MTNGSRNICACPKCGGWAAAEKQMIAIYPMWRVRCLACGHAGLPKETSDGAIDVWNRAAQMRSGETVEVM